MLIDVLGSFGSGKSSLVDILGDEFNAKKYLEDPDKVPILKDYYAGGKEARRRLSFALQIAWLDTRYSDLRKAIHDKSHKFYTNIYTLFVFLRPLAFLSLNKFDNNFCLYI